MAQPLIIQFPRPKLVLCGIHADLAERIDAVIAAHPGADEITHVCREIAYRSRVLERGYPGSAWRILRQLRHLAPDDRGRGGSSSRESFSRLASATPVRLEHKRSWTPGGNALNVVIIRAITSFLLSGNVAHRLWKV